MNVIGLNFSDSSIEAVEMKRGFLSNTKIVAMNRAELPEGAIINGVIKQREVVSKVVRGVLAQATPTPMSANSVAMAIPESQVFSRVMIFDGKFSHQEVKHKLQAQLPSYIPFEIKDITFDYILIHTSDASTEVMVVAVPLAILKEYVELARGLQLSISAIELESISSARAVLPDALSGGTTAVIDIGARTTIVSFFYNRQLNFTFNIPVAGNHLTKYLMKNLKLPEVEAERTKQHIGLVRGTNDDVVTHLEHIFEPIVAKLVEAIEYYQHTHVQTPVQQLILMGGTAQLPGIEEYFTQKVALPSVRGSVLPKYLKNSIVDHGENPQLLFANAIGLAVGSVNKSAGVPEINFLTHAQF